MKTLTQTLLLPFAACLFTIGTISAQDSIDNSLEISGSIDTYYRTTLNTEDNGNSKAPNTSFAGRTGFNIGMANLVVSKDGENAGFVADLVFGPRGNAAVFNAFSRLSGLSGGISVGNNALVNQLYAYWKPSDNLTFTIGNFNTFLGYEVIQPTANFNYSTSYMFSYGPFSHTGVKADVSLTDNFSAMVGVFNPTDLTVTSQVNTVTLGGQLGYSNDQGGAWLNVLYGDQDGKVEQDDLSPAETDTSSGPIFQVDLTTGWDLTDKFYVGLNSTLFSQDPGTASSKQPDSTFEQSSIDGDTPTFSGAALYLQYSFSETFALGIRGEYFAESNGGVGAIGAYDDNGDGNVIDLTLSGNINIDNLTLIPEIRMDATSEDAFTDKDGNATNMLSSVQLAAVYGF